MDMVVTEEGAEDIEMNTSETGVLVGIKSYYPIPQPPKMDIHISAARSTTKTEVGEVKLVEMGMGWGEVTGRDIEKRRLAYFTVMHSKTLKFTQQ